MSAAATTEATQASAAAPEPYMAISERYDPMFVLAEYRPKWACPRVCTAQLVGSSYPRRPPATSS